ncbi:MAG: type IV pilus modification protein PilV [Rhodoferax sp.]|uniref:type IV pilus modification protein PilV n=1 Tax=Rhodoferax sp. TaxID=50421 RepID=UPI003017F116
MTKTHIRARQQTGSMLIEVLIAILIFSIGILGIVGLQASAVTASTDARYRSEAALLANELIGRMWASDRTQTTLQAAYDSSTGTGAAYTAWAWSGTSGTAGTQSTPAKGTVLQTLPGALTNLPTVVITPVAATSLPSSLVTITIFWQAPNENSRHNYVVTAQIGG